MDEFTAVLRARELVKKLNRPDVPVNVEAYAEAIGAKVTTDYSMSDDEGGCSFEISGKRNIRVNGNHRRERQRYSVCHEVAHFALELPSEHGRGPWWSYAKRPQNEIICDIFAAELLLPYMLFQPRVEKLDISFAAVEKLAGLFKASLTATGSRFATVSRAPCAFVLSEQGKIRYPARSTPLRDAKAWISPGSSLPAESLAARVRSGATCEGPEDVPADIWFNDWQRGGQLLEDTRYHAPWDQTLSLLWFEDEEIPTTASPSIREEEEDVGLRELDGTLPWPGKRRRR